MNVYDFEFTIYASLAIALAIVNRKSPIVNEKCQGDHGRYGANYRCCLPALAGFVSPHSMGPDNLNLPDNPPLVESKETVAGILSPFAR